MRILAYASVVAVSMLGNGAVAQDAIKIAFIDPLSGGGASIGEAGLKSFQFIAEQLNAKGGIQGRKLEIVPFDNKLNPQESLIQAQKAIDAGIRYITSASPAVMTAQLVVVSRRLRQVFERCTSPR